jgi:hypothetical protein
MIKKFIFLILPLIVVYWRSNLAQNAVRWLFRGVLPTDGPLGQFVQATSHKPAPVPDSPIRSKPETATKPKSLAATIANNWPIILAFLAGVLVAAWVFSFGAAQN